MACRKVPRRVAHRQRRDRAVSRRMKLGRDQEAIVDLAAPSFVALFTQIVFRLTRQLKDNRNIGNAIAGAPSVKGLARNTVSLRWVDARTLTLYLHRPAAGVQ